MKHILFSVAALVFYLATAADNFKVSEIIGPEIKFRGKTLNVEDIINDREPITLMGNNVLTLFNMNKSMKTYTVSGSLYKKHKCRNFGDYFSSKAGTLTRDDKGNRSIQNQMDSVYIWVDDATVPTMYPKNNSRVFAIEIIDNLLESHVVELPVDDAGRSFSLPGKLLFGEGKPYPLVFNLLVGIKDPETEEISFETVVENSILLPLR